MRELQAALEVAKADPESPFAGLMEIGPHSDMISVRAVHRSPRFGLTPLGSGSRTADINSACPGPSRRFRPWSLRNRQTAGRGERIPNGHHKRTQGPSYRLARLPQRRVYVSAASQRIAHSGRF